MTINKKKAYIALISLIIILFGALSFIILQTKSDKIVKNVYINNINIGSISKESAKKILEEEYQLKDIKLLLDNKVWNIKPEEIEFSYNIDDTIEKAYKINKGNNLATNIVETVKSLLGNKINLEIEISFNKEKIEHIVENIAKEVNVDSKNASLSINGSNISISEEVIGKKVDEKTTINNIIENISNKEFNIGVVVIEDRPKVLKKDLENIDTVLGSYSTKFDSSIAGRSQNIKLSAQRTSDILLMPGETFSYNNSTGKRTLSNGYKNAPVIVQGVVQEGIGGGVCQVSTTLYNATLYAGLEYLELRNHSIPSSYAEKGRDATVADGSIDFVFKNNLNYPIYIKNSVYGNTVTCKIYGSSKDKQKIEILTNTDAVSIAPIKKVDDPTLEKGTEKVLEKGRDGYTVSTYRIYKDSNGKEIRREKVSKSYYPKKQGIIAVGTKENIIEAPSEETPIVTPSVDNNVQSQPNTQENEITTPQQDVVIPQTTSESTSI